MRIVFLGSGEFACPTLAALADSDHELAGVVTQPPRPAGRSRKPRPTPVAGLAERLGLDVFPCENINAPAAVARLQALRPDVMVVVDFGQFIRAGARSAAAIDTFNIHASLLPELRGAAPINWAIIRVHERTRVTTFSLVEKMDAGDIYYVAETDLGADLRALELRAVLAHLGAGVAIRTVEALAAGVARPVPQDHDRATRAPLMDKTLGQVDFAAAARDIRNLIHGTWPWPGARATYRPREGGKAVDLVLARAEVLAGDPPGPPGHVDAEGAVSTADGRVGLLEVKPAGKRLMSWRDFANGARLGEGDRLEGTRP